MRPLLLLALLVACNEVPEQDLSTDGPTAAEGVADAGTASDHRARAFAAYEREDYDGVVRETRAALAADPESTVDLYNLACGQSLAGDRNGAIATLRQLLERRVDYGVTTDPDFAPLHDDPEFLELAAAFDALYPRVAHSQRVADVTDRADLAPDGLAFDPASGRTFVSSMRTGAVYVMDPSGRARPFATLTIDGAGVSAMGLAVDPERRVLWAVGTAFSLHADYDEAHRGLTGLFALDLETGEVERVVRPQGDAGMGLHDVAIAPDGSVYATGRGLFHLGAEDRLSAVDLERPLARTSGITITPDGTMYVAAERKGIVKVDPDGGSWSWLEVPADLDLRHFDGLVWSDGDLAGLQLGLERWRAVRVDLDPAGNTVTGLEVLEQDNPEIAFATGATVIGDQLVYVGRSPLPEGMDRAQAGPAAGTTTVWKAPLRP